MVFPSSVDMTFIAISDTIGPFSNMCHTGLNSYHAVFKYVYVHVHDMVYNFNAN